MKTKCDCSIHERSPNPLAAFNGATSRHGREGTGKGGRGERKRTGGEDGRIRSDRVRDGMWIGMLRPLLASSQIPVSAPAQDNHILFSLISSISITDLI